MDTWQAFFLALGWFLLRFGVPVFVTVGLIKLFQRWDERWQAEALRLQKPQPLTVHCWELNNCPEKQRMSCPSYQDQEIPCWQRLRAADGSLKPECLVCPVFRGAPPVPATDWEEIKRV